jgi:hypothetical protein
MTIRRSESLFNVSRQRFRIAEEQIPIEAVMNSFNSHSGPIAQFLGKRAARRNR